MASPTKSNNNPYMCSNNQFMFRNRDNSKLLWRIELTNNNNNTINNTEII